jgi:hypothetical protein
MRADQLSVSRKASQRVIGATPRLDGGRAKPCYEIGISRRFTDTA